MEPDDDRGEVDGCQKVGGALVVAGGDGAVLFELGEEVLDQVARLVEVPVIRPEVLAVGLGRDHRRLAGLCEWFDHPRLGIKRLVGDQHARGEVRQQGIGSLQVGRLPRRERAAGRVAERVDRGVDLGAQATPAAPDGFIAAVFLAAPVLC